MGLVEGVSYLILELLERIPAGLVLGLLGFTEEISLLPAQFPKLATQPRHVVSGAGEFG